MIDVSIIALSRIEWRDAVRIVRSRLPPIDLFEDIADPIRRLLTQERTETAHREFLDSLRASYAVRIMLEPPRLAVSDGGGPARGPADAPLSGALRSCGTKKPLMICSAVFLGIGLRVRKRVATWTRCQTRLALETQPRSG